MFSRKSVYIKNLMYSRWWSMVDTYNHLMDSERILQPYVLLISQAILQSRCQKFLPVLLTQTDIDCIHLKCYYQFQLSPWECQPQWSLIDWLILFFPLRFIMPCLFHKLGPTSLLGWSIHLAQGQSARFPGRLGIRTWVFQILIWHHYNMLGLDITWLRMAL